MIIYNKTWLTNLLLIDGVEKEHQDGLITDTELKNIKEKYPVGFYSPNIFVRVGLILLTMVISGCASGLLSLMMADSTMVTSYGWLIFLGILNYVALEVMVQNKFHFRSGVDDALLWISGALWVSAFAWAVSDRYYSEDFSGVYLVASAFVCVLSSILAIRFADMLMGLVAYLACLVFVFFAWQKIGAWGTATMPFVLMVFSGLSYWVVRLKLNHPKTVYYTNSMTVLQAGTLLTLYLAGNYFVVKELGDELNGTVSESIPFGWFFWGWTIGLPFIYIAFGIKQKNVILLRTGLLLITAAAITFRNYHHVMPVELALILSGAIALGISYAVTRYLRTPRHGFTCEELNKEDLMDELKVESLVIAESFSDTAQPVADQGIKLGGGHFGGGGATSDF